MKALAFDLDGTLYPNREMYLHSLPFFSRYPRLVWHFSRVRKKIRKVRPIENFHHLQRELLAESMGITTAKSGELLREKIYGDWVTIFRGVKLFPGVREFLEQSRSRGFRLALLSDLPIFPKIEYLGLGGFFDQVLCSEKSGYLKPNPEPFNRLMELLKLPSSDILYIGNNYQYDILGANQVGMDAIHVTCKEKRESAARFSFASYRDLNAYLCDTIR